MKKFVKYLLVICLMVPFAFMFAGCGEQAPSNIMSMSVNPEIQFALDSNNNVLSVKFENNDASTLYADINFVGKDVDSTVQLFIERAAISGHIDLNGDEVTIEISGNAQASVTALKEKVKTQVEKTFDDLGVEVQVAFGELTEAAQRTALETQAKILAPEKTESEIKDMTNSELMKLINDKQKEYKDLAYSQVQAISQELEKTVLNAVNVAKTAVESAEKMLEGLEEQVKALPSLEETLKPQIDEAKKLVEDAKKTLNTKVDAFLKAKDEAIQKAKEKYAEVKEQLVNAFKTQVTDAKTTVIAHLDTEKELGHLTQEQYDYWVNLINSYANA